MESLVDPLELNLDLIQPLEKFHSTARRFRELEERVDDRVFLIDHTARSLLDVALDYWYRRDILCVHLVTDQAESQLGEHGVW